jgi:hypothetical protein
MFKQVFFVRQPLLVLIALLLLCLRAPVWAANVILTWSPSTSPAATGYEVYYGLASSNYTASVDAGATTNFTVTGLGPGLTYYFAVRTYDASNDASPFSVQVGVTTRALPQITEGPYSQTVSTGANVVFYIGVVNKGPMTFQWYHGATPVAGGGVLIGATDLAYLVLNNVSTANAGNYSVVIVSAAGSVTSSVATLTVLQPQQTMAAILNPGQGVQLQFTGIQGSNYVLLAAANLAPPVNWQPIVTNIASAGGAWTYLDTAALSLPARFYQIVMQ